MPIPNSQLSRAVGIQNIYTPTAGIGALSLPVRIAVFAQGNLASSFAFEPYQIFKDSDAGEVQGFGSPAQLIAKKLFPESGNNVGNIPVWVYPLEDGTTPAAGSITPLADQTETVSYKIKVNASESEEFSIPSDGSVADFIAAGILACNNIVDFPMIAADGTTKLDLTSKWSGLTANDLKISVVLSASTGSTFTLVQPTGGTGTPDINAMITAMNNNWETHIINALGEHDPGTLDDFQAGRVAREVSTKKVPFMAFYGSNETDLTTAKTVTESKRSQWCNSKFPAPGCLDLPFEIAANLVKVIAKIANEKPSFDYSLAELTDLTPGLETDQWDDSQRETAVQAGLSTSSLRNGVVTIEDLVTFYHPVGNVVRELSRVVKQIKIFTILYNLRIRFEIPEWAGAPLVPNDATTRLPGAKRPSDAKTVINLMLVKLETDLAIVVDAKASGKLTTAVISGVNNDRLDIELFPKISGNTNITDVLNKWSFYRGGNQ